MIGIVADDITGANDIGIMYAKAGFRVDVYTYPFERLKDGDVPDVLIINTNSRLDPRELAYEKVRASTEYLRSLGCRQFFNKTCSVFRGNIGAEFDAMLDALEEEFAVVVLGYPKNGRTTIHGVHYVHGKKLEESQFRYDPIHPMVMSNLVSILQSQTKRIVSSIDIEVIDEGSEKLKLEIDAMRSYCNYLILDVRDQNSLRIIAEAIRDEKIICGASGIAEELALVSLFCPSGRPVPSVPKSEIGVLCAAGSLMPQTRRQIEKMKEHGYPAFELDTRLIFSERGGVHIENLIEKTSRLLKEGKDILIYTSNEPEKVRETKRLGESAGLDGIQVSRTVSNVLSQVVLRVVENTGAERLLLAGGETSAAVCKDLGIHALTVWKEIEPGLPSCISATSPRKLLVLKSGSFGKPDFFLQAIDHLRKN
jgi:uncharacterized protein YgbK (DUF1537 family)